MLLSSARAVPAYFILSAAASRVISEPATLTCTPSIDGRFNEPFGPFTVTPSAATFTSTPFGRPIGFFATRDMGRCSLGDRRDDFAAQTLLSGLRVGHEA